VAHRQSLPLFGDGLVEATSDATFESIAASEAHSVRGIVRMVSDIDNFDGPAGEVSSATLADTLDSSGRADIDRFIDFMRGLQPPPPASQNASAQAGRQLFAQTDCTGCHTASITTDSNPRHSSPQQSTAPPYRAM
jgi:CxxC motif-containing protein (DUF1111 family)